MSASKPTPEELRAVLAGYPTGVTVITAPGERGPSGATANAVTSLSLDPPMMLACLDRGSRTLASALRSGRFGINVLAAGQEDLAARFAGKDPEDAKWAGVGFAEQSGVPRLAGTAAWLLCELAESHEGGDHLILTGHVIEAGADGSPPLVFHRGAYRPLDAPPHAE